MDPVSRNSSLASDVGGALQWWPQELAAALLCQGAEIGLRRCEQSGHLPCKEKKVPAWL